MSESSAGGYTANLVGAMALAVTDVIQRTIDGDAGSSEAGALVRIGTHPGQTITFLSAALRLSHSATVRVVDRLEGRGLVLRGDVSGSNGDGRAVGLYLTADGEAQRRSLVEQRYGALDPLLATLDASERELLRQIAYRVLGAAASENTGSICRFCDTPMCIEAGCPVPPPDLLADGEPPAGDS